MRSSEREILRRAWDAITPEERRKVYRDAEIELEHRRISNEVWNKVIAILSNEEKD